MHDLRIALVQMTSRAGDRAGNLARIEAFTIDAGSDGAAFICFPELAVVGYGRAASMRELAETVPGPTSEALARVARRTDVTILAGLLESDASGRVFNSHLAVGPDGRIAKYRKTHVPIIERLAFDEGDDLPAFTHPSARFGIQVCYDAHFPELSSVMVEDGAEILFMPHASAGAEDRSAKLDRWMRFLPARAYDNCVFVAVCNASGTTADGDRLPGIALVLDPFGRIVAMTDGPEEQMLVVDLHGDLLDEARGDENGFFGAYRRPELYRSGGGDSRDPVADGPPSGTNPGGQAGTRE